MISYYLKEKTKEDVIIAIQDSAGQTIVELKGSKDAGINRITWDLRYSAPESPGTGMMGRRFRARGPFILPGKYQVTLKAAGQEMTRSVEVEGDLRIDISFEDRKAQHDALYKIYKLTPVLSTAGRTVDNIINEIKKQDRILKKLPDVPEAVLEQIKAVSKEIENIRVKLSGDPKLGFRGMRFSVRGRLFMVGRSISGYTGAPSESQVQQIRKYTEELKVLIERINKIIEVDIPNLNKLMNEHNIPHIFPGKKIKID